MVRLFKEVGLPDTCYVQEAVYWLAFGRVPEFHFHDGVGDERMGEYSRQTGTLVEYDTYGFSESEFRSVGVAIDFARYDEARLFVQGEDAEQYIAEWDARFARYQPEPGQDLGDFERWKRETLDRVIRDAEEGEWARRMDEVFDQPIDLARMKVFEALASGDLGAVGWVADPNATDRDDHQGAFESVPRSAWSLRFDWGKSKLSFAGKTFLAIQVSCDRMLELFPRPSCSGETVSMRAYPGVAIVLDRPDEVATPSQPQPKTRGRPPADAGSLRDVVRNWYQATYENKVPPKAEAILAEAEAFVLTYFKRSASRSTLQFWLKGLAPLTDNVPENDARNSAKYAAE